MMKQISCTCCAGVEWSAGTEPIECSICKGNGTIWIAENGAIALYPGGPFNGTWGEYGRGRYINAA